MKRFKNILCVVAADCANEIAIERAVALASSNNASLTVTKIIEKIPPNTKLLDRTLFPDIQAKLVVNHEKKLENLVSPWRKQAQITTKVMSGILFLETIKEILRSEHDLVIKATEKDAYLQSLFGSDDMHLSRKCPCPVWLVNSHSHKNFHRIVAAVDVDDSYDSEELATRRDLNQTILEIASSLAQTEKAEFHVVHVMNNAEEMAIRSAFSGSSDGNIISHLDEAIQKRRENLQALMDTAMKKLDQSVVANIEPKVHLLGGHPRDEIANFSNKIEADIVVMGTVARTGIPGFFMGNTAEAIQNRINCSVLAIKPDGFVTPVTIDD